MDIDLSIVIVNFNSKKHLERCLESIRENNCGVDFEVIIVNNDNREHLFGKPFDRVRVIENRNSGFGSGCNLGAKAAGGRILMFLNPDAEILSGDVTGVLAEFDSEEIGIVGSRLIDAASKIQPWSAGCDMDLRELMRSNFGFPKSRRIWKSRKRIPVDWVSAAALFIPRTLFLDIGGFDEKIFMYFEDADLCKRVRNKGKRVLYMPDFSVKHLGGRSYGDKLIQKQDYYESLEYYFQKHHGSFQIYTLKIARYLFFK